MKFYVKTKTQMFSELSIILGAFFAFFMFLHSEIKSLDQKIESRTIQMHDEMNQQTARTDRLYEMFYELVKETRK